MDIFNRSKLSKILTAQRCRRARVLREEPRHPASCEPGPRSSPEPGRLVDREQEVRMHDLELRTAVLVVEDAVLGRRVYIAIPRPRREPEKLDRGIDPGAAVSGESSPGGDELHARAVPLERLQER